MVAKNPIVWTEGLCLSQQHLQYWDEMHAHNLAVQGRLYHPWYYGLYSLEIDTAALGCGLFVIEKLEAMMRDQYWLAYYKETNPPLQLDLTEQTSPITIYITHGHVGCTQGISGYPQTSQPSWSQATYLTKTDKYDSERTAEVCVATPHPKLLTQAPSEWPSLKIAEVIQISGESWQLSSEFLPTCLQIRACIELSSWCKELAYFCKESAHSYPAHTHHLMQASVELLHAARQSVLHPYSLYLCLLRAIGACSTPHTLEISNDFLIYRHDDLAATFTQLKHYLKDLLAQQQVQPNSSVCAQKTGPYLWQFQFKTLPNVPSKLQLQLIFQEGLPTWITQFQSLVKLAFSQDLQNLIRANSQGLLLQPCAKPGYYDLQLHPFEWQRLWVEKELSLYTTLPLDKISLEISIHHE